MNTIIKAVALLESENLLEPVVRKYWVHPMNKDREVSGRFSKFYNDIRQFSPKFFEYYRISISSFDELLQLLRPDLTKENTFMRNAITAEKRLTITLR